MSERTQPIDRKTRLPKMNRVGGAVLGVLMAGGFVAGCSIDQQPRPTASVAKEVPEYTPGTDSTDLSITPEQQAQGELVKYISSKERNDRLKDATNTLGLRVMKAARSGKLGPFDAYNPKTDEWASRNPDTSGWVLYQHSPQYGGTRTQYMVTVYRESNGSYNLDKGIKSVSVTPESDKKGSKGIELAAPGEGLLGADTKYSASLIYKHALASGDEELNWRDTVNSFNTDEEVKSVEKAKEVEAAVIRTANDLLNKDDVS